MKLSASVALAVLAGVDAIVSFSVEGKRSSTSRLNRRRPVLHRRSPIGLSLQNEFTEYQVELQVGTPAQTVLFQIDTGSSDLWTTSSDNPYCTTNVEDIEEGTGVNCTAPNSFNYQQSSTLKINGTDNTVDFFIEYADSTEAIGQWATDNVNVGGTTLNGASIAIATRANTSNVWGIGLQSTESTSQNPAVNTNYVYDNIPIQLKTSGAIESVSYSLWLNDLNSLQGELLFGGVDHTKYNGTLGVVPVVDLAEDEPGLAVMLHGISLYNGQGNSAQIVQCSFPVLLDSGTTIVYLPQDIIDTMGKSLGATYNSDVEAYIFPCTGSGYSEGFSFDFSGVEITSPIELWATPLTDVDGDTVVDNHGNTICGLNVSPSGDSGAVFGDIFLRSAFVVYHLDNMQIAMANAVYNVTSSNVESIGSSIPSATSAASYSSTQTDSEFSTNIVTNIISLGSVNANELGIASGSAATALPSITAQSVDPFATRTSVASGALNSAGGISGSTAAGGSSSSSSSSKSHNGAELAHIGSAGLVGAIVAALL